MQMFAQDFIFSLALSDPLPDPIPYSFLLSLPALIYSLALAKFRIIIIKACAIITLVSTTDSR